MKDFLAKNVEKVLLTVLLFTLAICSVYQILTMGKEGIDELIDESSGSMVGKSVIPKIEAIPIALAEHKAKPYDPRGYIYCRKSDCDYLILDSETKCPWCKTETKPAVIVKLGKEDTDGDGIPDEKEIHFNLDKDNPKDAFFDLDTDGFTNIDEYKMGTSMGDADDHPSIINRTKLTGKKDSYYPMTVSTIDTGKFDPAKPKDLLKKTWNIYADIYIKGRKRPKSKFYRINDPEPETDYTVADVGIDKAGKPFVVFKKGEEAPITVYAGKKRIVSATYFTFYNELDEKTYRAFIGKEFFLSDKKGIKEKYKLESFDRSARSTSVIDYKGSKKVKVGLEVMLKGAGEATELEDLNDDDLLELELPRRRDR